VHRSPSEESRHAGGAARQAYVRGNAVVERLGTLWQVAEVTDSILAVVFPRGLIRADQVAMVNKKADWQPGAQAYEYEYYAFQAVIPDEALNHSPSMMVPSTPPYRGLYIKKAPDDRDGLENEIPPEGAMCSFTHTISHPDAVMVVFRHAFAALGAVLRAY